MPADLPPFARHADANGEAAPDIYDDGYLRVEHDNYYVTCNGEALKFRRTEFLLLSRLTLSAARIVKAEELWHHVWGNSKPYNGESLHVHIYRLRIKLAPFHVRIETMVNVGYRLVLDVNGTAERRRESA
jgi:DNA-binding response OmpR family regulator